MDTKRIAMMAGGALVAAAIGGLVAWKLHGSGGSAGKKRPPGRAPTDAEVAEDELKYGRSKLRYALLDVAIPCNSGATALDSPQKLQLSYTLVIDKEVMSTKDVTLQSTDIANQTTVKCIVDAISGAHVPAPGLANIEQKQNQSLSLHDLFLRSQGQRPM